MPFWALHNFVKLDRNAHAGTKLRVRSHSLQALRVGIDSELGGARCERCHSGGGSPACVALDALESSITGNVFWQAAVSTIAAKIQTPFANSFINHAPSRGLRWNQAREVGGQSEARLSEGLALSLDNLRQAVEALAYRVHPEEVLQSRNPTH